MHRIPLGRLTIATQAVMAVLFVGYTLAKMDLAPRFLADSYELEVAFPDASGLDEADEPPVTVAGVDMGRVTDVRYEDGGGVATLSLDDGTRGRIFSDASAELVPRSGLQDLNVNIDPGSPENAPLSDGVRIPARRTSTYVGFDRFTEILDADTRAYLQVMLGELARALEGRPGDLRDAIERLQPVVSSSGRVAAALADRRRLLGRLVSEFEVIFRTLGRRGDQLAAAIRAGEDTLVATAGRESELAASMRALPGMLDQATGALRELTRLADPLTPALEQLRPAARALPAGARSLRRFLPNARDLLERLEPLVRDGRAPVRDTRRLLTRLGSSSRALQPIIDRFDALVEPLDEDRHLMVEFLEQDAGVASVADDNGTFGRSLSLGFEPIDPANFGLPSGTPADGPRIRELGLDLTEALTLTCRDRNVVACIYLEGLPRLLPLTTAGRKRR